MLLLSSWNPSNHHQVLTSTDMTAICMKCQKKEELVPPAMLCPICTAQMTSPTVRMSADEKSELAHKHVLGIVAELRRKKHAPGTYRVPLINYASEEDYYYFRQVTSDSLTIRCEYADYLEVKTAIATALRTVFGYDVGDIQISRQNLINYMEDLESSQ